MTDLHSSAGKIGWVDLTVEDADQALDFYTKVTGWKSTALSMGDYNDYCVGAEPDSNPVAGICHARGANSKVPPQWIVYITVADLDQSLAKCTELGGEILDGPRGAGGGRIAIIRDPAGAVAGLYGE
ncbi:MAG: VOC family protein [Candidatus Zixiibacteriota bacterium]